MTDDEFLLAFQICTFQRSEWTHEAHVRMAWLYLTRKPFVEALDRIRCGIRKLNAKIGQPANTHRAPAQPTCKAARRDSSNGDPNGYHETITVALTRIIAAACGSAKFAAFRDRSGSVRPQIACGFQHYSKSLLWSPEADVNY